MIGKDNNDPNDQNDMNNPSDNNHMPVIFSYTRAQAIADGVLVDLTDWARQTGYRVPVACTSAIWDGYIVPTDGLKAIYHDSERGRAHDLLWMLLLAIRKSSRHAEQIDFQVIFRMPNGKVQTVALKAVCGPGDNGEPVITILLPDED